jgi:AcrR family transcriptional regulator
MREIAQEAGMPVPTMYQYLRSKDEILASIFDNYLAQVEASVRVSSAESVTASDKLKAALAANLAEFDRFHAQVRLMTRETRSLQPQARERVKKHMLQYIDLFRSMIAKGIEAGEFRAVDPDLYANFIAMLCEVWPLRHWSVGPHGLPAVQAGIVDLVLYGLQKREGVPG